MLYSFIVQYSTVRSNKGTKDLLYLVILISLCRILPLDLLLLKHQVKRVG